MLTAASPRESQRINSAKDLKVYKAAYDLAMKIFEISKTFPPEERFALTSQIRRSSRSVCLNLREAWAKRRYEAHFVNKLTDCDGENSETDSSLDFARDCKYIAPAIRKLSVPLRRSRQNACQHDKALWLILNNKSLRATSIVTSDI